MKKLRSEAGQAAALTAVFMTVLLGSCAAVLDVGAWFREDRDTQRIADAAALAGAQELPKSTSAAEAAARAYAKDNGLVFPADGTAFEVGFSSQVMDDDTISVKLERDAPGFFANIFGIAKIKVGSTAKARIAVPGGAKFVAPIVVNEKHPRLVAREYGKDNAAKIVLEKQHKPGSGDAAGSFGLLNLDPDSSGAPGTDTMADWMLKGYEELLKPGVFTAAPSALFNSSEMSEALTLRTGTVVLFPVCEATGAGDSCKIDKGGQNAEYEIIGWVAFHITGYDNRGVDGVIDGYFTDAIWQGEVPASQTTPDFGVRTIALVD